MIPTCFNHEPCHHKVFIKLVSFFPFNSWVRHVKLIWLFLWVIFIIDDIQWHISSICGRFIHIAGLGVSTPWILLKVAKHSLLMHLIEEMLDTLETCPKMSSKWQCLRRMIVNTLRDTTQNECIDKKLALLLLRKWGRTN